MSKKVYFLANGAATKTMSGGVKNFLEIAKRFSRDGFEVNIITNPVGKAVYEENQLTNVNYVLTEPAYKELSNPFELVVSYVRRAFAANRIIREILKKTPKEERIFVFASEIYCNTLSLASLKNENKILIFNMVAPNPFKGYVQKLHLPSFAEVHYQLSQLLVFLLMKFFAGLQDTKIIAVSENIKHDLLRRPVARSFPIEVVPLGVDFTRTSEEMPAKIYDFVWIGRNHPQKGVDDLEKMLIEFKKEKPDFTLLVLGDANGRLEAFARSHGLENNLILKGVVQGDGKYAELAKGKVLLFTSHFESFGIVVIENMLVRNTVVGYDISTSTYNFDSHMVFVPKFDWRAFSKKALEALSQYPDEGLLDKNFNFARSFNWENSYQNYKLMILAR